MNGFETRRTLCNGSSSSSVIIGVEVVVVTQIRTTCPFLLFQVVVVVPLFASTLFPFRYYTKIPLLHFARRAHNYKNLVL